MDTLRDKQQLESMCGRTIRRRGKFGNSFCLIYCSNLSGPVSKILTSAHNLNRCLIIRIGRQFYQQKF